jgi:multimeric flavodoxin WrbA
MIAIAINGSPRKDKNTATLLARALEGAASQGAEPEMIHLYDIPFKGCISCFECKKLNGKSYGCCAVHDRLAPVLEKAAKADVILLGTPVYFGQATGVMRMFLERMLFPYHVYDAKHSTLMNRKIHTAVIYTLGATDERIKTAGYDSSFQTTARFMTRIFGSSEILTVTNTWQFDDYSKYETSGIDVRMKEEWRQNVFPEDCRKAYELGARLAAACLPPG